MKTELLSPAGDFESLKKAVFAGANAVYFGAKNFNARAKANNFGQDIIKAVAFCHMYGVKAYLTLNTLIENTDAKMLVDTAKNALECGIDAFIVQDFGVLNLLKNCFKNVEIHTSTQMAVNNYLGAVKAQEMGAKRVVLSRETSLKDIKLIREKTNLQIEYFIHGALCVCFSGNCYLSSNCFAKSGNKGECLQPCRLPYSAYINNQQIAKGYLLSAKDISMANRLKDMQDAGVNSFKIEGRLKRPAYVAGVTQIYRQIIDNNLLVNEQHINNLKKLFNRGNFTEGYFNGNDNIIDANVQGHRGIEIGRVVSFNKGKKFNVVKVVSNHNICSGDTIKFIKNQKEIVTITAVDIKKDGKFYNITTTANIQVGSTANLILDSKYETALLDYEKKLPINFVLTCNIGEPIDLEYYFNGISGKVTGGVCEASKNAPLTENEAYNQLSKLGDTYFYLQNFIYNADNVFVTKKELNNLRRQAVEKIIGYYEKKKPVECNYNYINEVSCITTIKNKNQTLEITSENNTNADFLVIRPQNYSTFNYSKINHKNAFLYVPAFLAYDDIELINQILTKNKNLGIYAENIGALALSNNRKTILGAKLNIKNVYALKELANKNIVAVVASPEISENNFQMLKRCCELPLFKSNFNNFDLMMFVHCPIKTIYKNNCNGCKFNSNIKYKMENGQELYLKRNILKHCYFFLSKNVDNNNQILYTN